MASDALAATVAVNGIEVVRVVDEHLEALAEFYRRVWDPEATIDSVRASRVRAAAANPVVPGEPPPTWLVLQNGCAIAHVTTIPIRLWLRGSDRPAYWIKGLWVLPEFRRSSAGFLVLRAAVGAVHPALAIVHEPAAIRLFQALGFQPLGALPNAMRVLRARALLTHLDVDAVGLASLPPWKRAAVGLGRVGAPVLAPMLDAAFSTWALLRGRTPRGLTVDVDDRIDRPAVDRLWTSARQEITAAPARSGAHMVARYAGDVGYVFVHVRSHGQLVAFGVVKRPREDGDPRVRGIRIATLSDLLYRPGDPHAGLAALRGCERAARLHRADALLASASAASIAPLLGRRGFLRLPPNLNVLGRFPGEAVEAPSSIGESWFTRGDSLADDSF